MIGFSHSGSETRIYSIPSGKIEPSFLAICQDKSLIKNILKSFDNNAENFYKWLSQIFTNAYPKHKSDSAFRIDSMFWITPQEEH